MRSRARWALPCGVMSLLVSALVISILSAPTTGDAQTTDLNAAPPMSKEEILQMLAKGSDSGWIALYVKKDGVDFEPSEQDLDTFRAAGASETLLGTIREAKRVRTPETRQGQARNPGLDACRAALASAPAFDFERPAPPSREVAMSWEKSAMDLWLCAERYQGEMTKDEIVRFYRREALESWSYIVALLDANYQYARANEELSKTLPQTPPLDPSRPGQVGLHIPHTPAAWQLNPNILRQTLQVLAARLTPPAEWECQQAHGGFERIETQQVQVQDNSALAGVLGPMTAQIRYAVCKDGTRIPAN